MTGEGGGPGAGRGDTGCLAEQSRAGLLGHIGLETLLSSFLTSWPWSDLKQPQSCQALHRTGKKTLGGDKQNLVCIRTQEKGAVIPQETEPDLPVSVQKSPVEARVGGSLLQG